MLVSNMRLDLTIIIFADSLLLLMGCCPFWNSNAKETGQYQLLQDDKKPKDSGTNIEE